MQLFTLDFEDDYALIGIHSTEEDYRLAYLLNKHLNTRFKRFKNNLDFSNSEAEYPLFDYKDKRNYINYYFINNKYTKQVKDQTNPGLFGGNYSTVEYLIPEKNKIDFFLKIEGSNDETFARTLVDKLNNINQIITSFTIDPNNLKSKNNLIF